MTETPFRAADIVAIRWKNFFAAENALNIAPVAPHIPEARVPVAQTIVNLFAAAGYSQMHQIAALANAVRESSLNPTARGDGGLSIGLFQCHTTKGEGVGHQISDLEDPDYNTKVIISVANRHGEFKDATSLEKAVDVFVRKVERPHDTLGEIAHRTQVAHDIMAALT